MLQSGVFVTLEFSEFYLFGIYKGRDLTDTLDVRLVLLQQLFMFCDSDKNYFSAMYIQFSSLFTYKFKLF